MAQLIPYLYDSLFANVLVNDQHVPRYILPDGNNHLYSLRPRRHELLLATKRDSRNFVDRLLLHCALSLAVQCIVIRVRIGPERTGTAFRFFFLKPERRSGSFF